MAAAAAAAAAVAAQSLEMKRAEKITVIGFWFFDIVRTE